MDEINNVRVYCHLKEKKSRQELAKELSLGEGKIKAILTFLKSKGLISSYNNGHKRIKEVPLPEIHTVKTNYYRNKKKLGCIINTKKEVNYVNLRDLAVRQGAEGALIFTYTDRLRLPGVTWSFKEIEKQFEFKKNDLLIVVFDEKKEVCEKALIRIISQFVDLGLFSNS